MRGSTVCLYNSKIQHQYLQISIWTHTKWTINFIFIFEVCIHFVLELIMQMFSIMFYIHVSIFAIYNCLNKVSTIIILIVMTTSHRYHNPLSMFPYLCQRIAQNVCSKFICLQSSQNIPFDQQSSFPSNDMMLNKIVRNTNSLYMRVSDMYQLNATVYLIKCN